MSSMFEGAQRFNSDVDDWDVSRVTSMQAMFKVSKCRPCSARTPHTACTLSPQTLSVAVCLCV